VVNATDLLRVRNNSALPGTAPINSLFDINRDRTVNATDLLLVRNNSTLPTTALQLLDLSGAVATLGLEGGGSLARSARLASTRDENWDREGAEGLEAGSATRSRVVGVGVTGARFTALRVIEDGSLRFRVEGANQAEYRILASSDLGSDDWQEIVPQPLFERNGDVLEFTLSRTPSTAQQMYRIVVPVE
jgi:hypothetical protein